MKLSEGYLSVSGSFPILTILFQAPLLVSTQVQNISSAIQLFRLANESILPEYLAFAKTLNGICSLFYLCFFHSSKNLSGNTRFFSLADALRRQKKAPTHERWH